MPVTIRLTRRGSNRRPFYHVVVADSRFPRDGRCLEEIGFYDPRGNKPLAIDAERAQKWLSKGATTSATVKKLFKRAGVGNETAT